MSEGIKGERLGGSWIEVPKVVVQNICFKSLNNMAHRSSIFANLKCLKYTVQLAFCNGKLSLKLRNCPRYSKEIWGGVSVKNKLQLCISPVLFCSLLVIYTMFQNPEPITDFPRYLNSFIHSVIRQKLTEYEVLFRGSRWQFLNKIEMASTLALPPPPIPCHGVNSMVFLTQKLFLFLGKAII